MLYLDAVPIEFYRIISEIKAESAHTDAEQLSRSEAGTSVQQEEKLGLTKERRRVFKRKYFTLSAF